MAKTPGVEPDLIDVYVGQQLRTRRVEAGLNQSQLGGAIGVTFQQVQKYEKGVNRVSASMLHRCSEALKCHPSDFFPVEGDPGPRRMSIATAPGGVRLAALYVALTPGKRKLILDLAEALSESSEH